MLSEKMNKRRRYGGWIWSFLLFLNFSYVDAEIRVFTSALNTTTSSFPLPPLNRNSNKGALVGKIRARDISNSQRLIKYNLLGVFATLKNGETLQPVNVGEASNWNFIAGNLRNDDCLRSSIDRYPQYRRQFCIDHDTGSIYTTEYFTQNPPPSGLLYKFQIQYKSPPITFDSVSPHSVRIFSSCDNMTNIYKSISNSCNHNGSFILPLSANSFVAARRNASLYLTNIKLDLNSIETFPPGVQAPVKGDKISATVRFADRSRKGSVTYLHPATYYISFDPPVKTFVADRYQLFFHTSNNDLPERAWKPPSALISSMYLTEQDFCSVSGSCITLTDQYMAESSKYRNECVTSDEYDFIAKYGYCSRSKAPIITKTLSALDYDNIQRDKKPAKLLSNYAQDTNKLEYELINVISEYPKEVRSVTVQNHIDCQSSLVKRKTPLAYFCVNKATGSIYSTDILATEILPDDSFNLSIVVKTANVYPVRTVLANITFKTVSICSTRSSSFRDVVGSSCEKTHFAARFKVLPTQISDNIDEDVEAYETKLEGDFLLPHLSFFVTGIQRTSSVLNMNPNQDGSHVKVLLKNGIDNATSIHYFAGRYSPFVPPLKYKYDDSLILSAYFYDGSTGAETQYPIELNKWRTVIIKAEDYCSNSPSCVELYKSFLKSNQNSLDLEKKCPDTDYYGFKAKYGYCADNDPPTLVKSKYSIDMVSLKGGIQEVIPQESPMFVTDSNPLKFKLEKISSNFNFSTFTRASQLTFHSTCTDVKKTPPQSFFCIDEKTGRIFATSDMKEVSMTTATTFIFRVNVLDNSKYPMRNLTYDIKLSVNDECSPASNTYEELSTCVEYDELPASRLEEGNNLVFLPKGDRQRGLSLKFKQGSISPRLRIRLVATVFNSQQVQIKQSDSSPEIIPDIPVNTFHTIAINLPRLAKGYSVKVRFIRSNQDNTEVEIPLGNAIVSNFILVNMVAYKCESTCVEKYLRWREEAKNVSQALGKDCLKDPNFYAINFDQCTDPQAKFRESLSILPNITTGSTAVISNCIYSSPLQFAMAYWLKDGSTVKRNATTSRLTIYDEPTGNPLYRVSNLTVENVQLSNQGSYKCVIENDGVKISSEKVYLKLTDVSESVLVMQTKVDWNLNYNNSRTSDYQILEKRLKTKMEDRIKAVSQLTFGSSFILIGFSGPDQVTAEMKILISNANHATRLSYCNVLQEAFSNDSLVPLNVTSIKLTTLDCCLESKIGEEDLRGEYIFNTILTGNSVTLPCVYNNNQSVTRSCITNLVTGPEWDMVDLSDCKTRDSTTQKLIDLKVEVVDEENFEEIASNASSIAEQNELKNTHDIEFMSDIIRSVVSVNQTNNKVAKSMLNCVDAVLRADKDVVVAANKRTGSSKKILDDLNTLALVQKPQKRGEYFEVAATPNMALGLIQPLDTLPLTIFSPTHLINSDVHIKITKEEQIDQKFDTSIQLPAEVMEQAINESVFSYIFETDVLFLTEKSINNKTAVNSKIMSATVGRKNISNLDNPILLNFTTSSVENRTGESYCKYWDPALNDSLGGWSSEGCETYLLENSSNIHCKCRHLTNFAIILDVSQTFNNPLALQIISYIGCGLSIVGLLLTLITHLIFRKIRRKVPAKILINLSFALLMTLIVFLAGADKVKSRTGCRIVALLLQYFILATFCWMVVEGLNLYRNFVKVFSGGSTGKFLMKAYIFGWGVPTVVTAITAGAQWTKFGPSSDEDPQFCVLQGTPFYFALLAPVCVTLIGNTVVLVLVLRGINGGSKVKNDSKSQEKNKLQKVRIAFACAVLLGLTWLFAILAVGDLRDFFQWLFCILNSLQGFFIFIFYTVRSVEARREWLEMFGVKQMKNSISSGATKSSTRGKTTIKMEKKPSTAKMEKKPATDKIENKPATDKMENKPAPDSTDNEPATDKIENEPATDKMENEPATDKNGE